MPMHDWSKVKAGTYHNFHQLWTSSITNQLNSGILPRGCFAMAEQIIGGPEPDVVALKLYDDPIETHDGQRSEELGFGGNGIALAEPQLKPTTSMVMIAEEDRYVLKSNRIVIRHELGNVLAIIELVSPAYHSFLSSFTAQNCVGGTDCNWITDADHAPVSSQRIFHQRSVGNKLPANLGRIADRAETNNSDAQCRWLTPVSNLAG